MLEYDYVTTHQPDAHHAPFAFLSGLSFSADIERVYEALRLPVWLAYGTRGEFSDVDAARMTDRANWIIRAFDAGALPYFEQPERFVDAYETFLGRARAGS